MAITLPVGIVNFSNIKGNLIDGECSHPAGHCFGSEGGTGIPEELKVPKGIGGPVEAWELNPAGSKLQKKYVYQRCQYCGKYLIDENGTEKINE